MMISELSRNHTRLRIVAIGTPEERVLDLPDAHAAASATGVACSWSVWGDPTGYVLVQDWGDHRILGTWLFLDDPLAQIPDLSIPQPRGSRAYALALAALHYEAVTDCAKEEQ